MCRLARTGRCRALAVYSVRPRVWRPEEEEVLAGTRRDGHQRADERYRRPARSEGVDGVRFPMPPLPLTRAALFHLVSLGVRSTSCLQQASVGSARADPLSATHTREYRADERAGLLRSRSFARSTLLASCTATWPASSAARPAFVSWRTITGTHRNDEAVSPLYSTLASQALAAIVDNNGEQPCRREAGRWSELEDRRRRPRSTPTTADR